MPRQWQSDIESKQLLIRHRGFTFTTTADTAQDAATISNNMSEGHKITFVVELNDLYVDFDTDATTSSMLIPTGTGYSEDNISIETRISVRNATAGANGRIRGIVWGR